MKYWAVVREKRQLRFMEKPMDYEWFIVAYETDKGRMFADKEIRQEFHSRGTFSKMQMERIQMMSMKYFVNEYKGMKYPTPHIYKLLRAVNIE